MSSELDQENIDESATAVLKESNVNKELIQSEVCISLLSDEEDEVSDSKSIVLPLPIPLPPVPIPIPMMESGIICLNEPHALLNGQYRSLSEPLANLTFIDGCSPVKVAERLSVATPVILIKPVPPPVLLDSITISDSEDNSESSVETTKNKTLKRKRSLIPRYVEVENSRKTMRPGPKSKTRNIATVHQMISAGKQLGPKQLLKNNNSDCSDNKEMVVDADEENENEEEETIEVGEETNEDQEESEEKTEEDQKEIVEESGIVVSDDVISIGSSNDGGEGIYSKIEIGNDTNTSSDNAVVERALSSNDTGVLENNTIDQNKIEDEIMKNSELINNEIDLNKVTEDDILKDNVINQNKIEDEITENNELINKDIDLNKITKD